MSGAKANVRALKKKNVATAVKPGAKAGRSQISGTIGSPLFVVRGIMRGLYLGNYVPGQRLVEADLVRDFGVSRGSIREALNRLSADGIVLLNRHRGAEIRRLSLKETQDILVVLEQLLGLAARLAAVNVHQSDQGRELFMEAVKVLLSMESEPDTYDLLRVRNRFYRALLDLGGNGELARMLPKAQVHLVRSLSRAIATRKAHGRFVDYRKIAEAVLAGNAAQAEAAGRKHVRRVFGDLKAMERVLSFDSTSQ